MENFAKIPTQRFWAESCLTIDNIVRPIEWENFSKPFSKKPHFIYIHAPYISSNKNIFFLTIVFISMFPLTCWKLFWMRIQHPIKNSLAYALQSTSWSLGKSNAQLQIVMWSACKNILLCCQLLKEIISNGDKKLTTNNQITPHKDYKNPTWHSFNNKLT